MKYGRSLLLIVSALFAAGACLAQQTNSEREIQMQRIEMEREQAEVERRMREAERRLAEAAQQIAELSSRQLPRVAEIERRYKFDGRPKLGVNIGTDKAGPVEGVSVIGVSPGGAADEAGLRSGDTLIAINSEPLKAGSTDEANKKLLEFMSGVEEGDVVTIEYLRNGKSGQVELAPQVMSGHAYAFGSAELDLSVPVAPLPPRGDMRGWVWMSAGSGFGDMELVTLTERLGRYFGTDKGLLVVRAPDNDEFQLEDGDVIQRIDGREPTSVSHAMRILGSYQAGEKFEIEIMRDKRKQKLNVDMPDNRQSRLQSLHELKVVADPAPLKPTAPPAATKPDDRT